MTDLPRQYAPTLSTQQQHSILRGKCNAVDALWEGHNGFLVALLPAVYVHNCLLRLRSEYVRAAHGNAIRRSSTLLEDMSLGGQWLVFVDENARVLGDTCVRLRRRRYGGYKVFGQHAECARVLVLRAGSSIANFSESFGGARLCAVPASGCHHRSSHTQVVGQRP